MPKAKKILITTESHEIFIVRANGRSEIQGFCKQCMKDTELLTIDEAVAFSGIGTLDIVKSIREGKIHSLETASGHLLICKNTLRAQNQKEQTKIKRTFCPRR